MAEFDTFGGFEGFENYGEKRYNVKDRGPLKFMDTTFLSDMANRERYRGKGRNSRRDNPGKTENKPSFKDKVSKAPNNKVVMAMNQALLDDFVQAYNKNKTNTIELYEMMKHDFPAVCKLMTNYHNDKYDSIVESMNNVLDLMTTKVFSTALLTIATDREEADAWDDEAMDNMGILISLVMSTSRNKMIKDTAERYREIISDVLCPVLRKTLEDEFGISDDAATDLLIVLPKFGKKLSNKEIKLYADMFLTWLLAYYDEMISCMDAEQQEKLFTRAFPNDDNNQTIKVVGQCLAKEALHLEDDKQAALYKEYIKALYSILGKADIPEIKMVLKFIVNELVKREAEHKDAPIVFNPDDAVEQENIDIALGDYVDTDATAKKIFLEDNNQ